MAEREEFPEIGPDAAWALYIASLLGVEELAHELKRLGLSDWEDCLEEARRFGPILHEAIEEARRGEG